MTNVTIKSSKIKNCTLQIKDGYNRDVGYTWSEDRKTITTEMVVGQSYALIITANDGYVFNNLVKIEWSISGMYFTVHDDKKTATFYGANAQVYQMNYSNITITAIAEESTEPPKFTENYEHCTSNITGQTLVKNQSYNIVLTADSGYYFNDAPTLTSKGNTYNFTISSDTHTATLNFTVVGDFTITATAILESVIPPKVTENYEHCTSNITGRTLVKNQSYNIVLTADSGYYFNDAPTLTSKGNTYNFTISSDTHTATLNFTVVGDFTITATAILESVIPPKVTENYEHCTSNITGRTLVKNQSYNIVLTADSGYYFNNAPTLNQDGYIYEFNISSDTHTATMNGYVVVGDFTITATAISEIVEDTDYTFFRMYSPDDRYLSKFADNIVYQIGGEGFTEYDLTPYIYALYVLPFNLSTMVELVNVTGIKFNKYTYKSDVPSIPNSNRIFSIDFGSLNFERQFNSDFDFDCSIQLDIPFFGSIDLNSYDVIGRSVNIVGYVNLFNRTMNIVVSGENGDIIAEQKQQIGYAIPYLSQSYKTASTYSDSMTNNLTGVRAVVTYDFEIKKVSEISGYVKADFVEPVESDFIGEDWDNIREILESGVIYG